MKNYKLAIDIGGTFIKYALVDEEYELKEKWKVKSEKFDDKDKFYDYICSNIKEIDLIDSIGVSAPGVIGDDSTVKSHVAPNVDMIFGTNINNEIERRTNKKTRTINDAKSAGLCEVKLGNAKGTSSSAFLILGTGTGGCVGSKDGVIVGKDGVAGEFHKLPSVDYKTGERKCMGDYASITALISIYNEKVDDASKVEYGTEVCDKYLSGDETAKEAVTEWINNIVTQLLTIVIFYNPEVICIGGGISEEDWFINLLRDAFKEQCVKHVEADIVTTKIDRCKYNNDANLIGAVLNLEDNK